MNKGNVTTANEVVNPHVAGNWYSNLHHQKQSNSEAIEKCQMDVLASAKQIKDMFGLETVNALIDGIAHYVENVFNQLEECDEFGNLVIDSRSKKEILNGIFVRSESAKMLSNLISPLNHIEVCKNRIELAEKGVKL